MTSSRAWGSHGPRSIPVAAFPFIVAALVSAVSREQSSPGYFPDPLETTVLSVLPGLAIALIGAAIVIRHPRAHRSVPLLLFGATLLAMQVAGAPLVRRFLNPIDPGFGGQSAPPFELYVLFFAALTTVGAFGWAYLARGLVQARRFKDVGRTGFMFIVAGVAAVIPTAVVVGSADIDLGADTWGIGLTVLAVVSVSAGMIENLAIGYTAVTATRGWLAAEAPRRAWGLAAIGAWLLLVAVLVGSTLPVVGVWLFESVDSTWAFLGVSLMHATGGVALFVGFALGLPDVDEITWYDLAELDAEAAADGAASLGRDPFDDSDASDEAELFELADRRLER